MLYSGTVTISFLSEKWPLLWIFTRSFKKILPNLIKLLVKTTKDLPYPKQCSVYKHTLKQYSISSMLSLVYTTIKETRTYKQQITKGGMHCM